MSNTKTSLIYYCKTDDGWKRFPAVTGKNNRVRPGYAMVNGEPAHFPEGRYLVRYYDGSKVRYEPAGKDAQEAETAREQKARVLEAHRKAAGTGAKVVEEPGRVNLQTALQRFLKDKEQSGALVARGAYKLACEAFLDSCKRHFLDEVEKSDFPKFQSDLRQKGLSARTIFNKQVGVLSFLRYAGISPSILPTKHPGYEKKLPNIYTEDDIKKLFAAIDNDYERIVFNLALKCGLRDQELMHVQWSDIEGTTLHVRSKPAYKFHIKDKEERSLPVPTDLLNLLHKYRKQYGQRLFITGTRPDRPNSHLLRLLKRLVRRVNLHCGVCAGCCAPHHECEKWTLHRFRRTYCTTLLRSGIDLSTVQHLMGHADIATTMRYLRPHEDSSLLSKVNAVKWPT